MHHVWNTAVPLPQISGIEKIGSERITIKPFEPERDGYIFLHGVALAKFKGRMYCSWAHNKVKENTDDEEVNYAVSDDNGRTWSHCIQGNCRPEEGIAVSHGAFLVHDDALYFFAPQFKGKLGSEMMRMSAYRFDEQEERFRSLGVVLDERFWPMCEPTRMEDGNYILPGIYVGASYHAEENTAAVAISHGDDILHWDMVLLSHEDTVKVWGECCITVSGSTVRMYCREHSRQLKALYAESNDFGRTWSKLGLSNLAMIDSKPYSGTLSDGRRYLICSCAADIQKRTPLTVAITKPNDDQFYKLYTVDEGGHLSYPYAIESDGKLYVAYSSTTEGYNRNSAELAIIDLEDLK